MNFNLFHLHSSFLFSESYKWYLFVGVFAPSRRKHNVFFSLSNLVIRKGVWDGRGVWCVCVCACVCVCVCVCLWGAAASHIVTPQYNYWLRTKTWHHIIVVLRVLLTIYLFVIVECMWCVCVGVRGEMCVVLWCHVYLTQLETTSLPLFANRLIYYCSILLMTLP